MPLNDDPEPYHRGLWTDHSQHHCLQERSEEQPRQTVDNGREAGLCPPAPGRSRRSAGDRRVKNPAALALSHPLLGPSRRSPRGESARCAEVTVGASEVNEPDRSTRRRNHHFGDGLGGCTCG